MKNWKMLAAVPMALVASQALAKNWVAVASDDGASYSIDKDSIRRDSDSLIYFTESESGDDGYVTDDAVDCQRRVIYLVKTTTGSR